MTKGLEHWPAQVLSNQQSDDEFHWTGFLAKVTTELGFKGKARASLSRWPGEVSTRCTFLASLGREPSFTFLLLNSTQLWEEVQILLKCPSTASCQPIPTPWA